MLNDILFPSIRDANPKICCTTLKNHPPMTQTDKEQRQWALRVTICNVVNGLWRQDRGGGTTSCPALRGKEAYSQSSTAQRQRQRETKCPRRKSACRSI